jgi:hypothetical protein
VVKLLTLCRIRSQHGGDQKAGYKKPVSKKGTMPFWKLRRITELLGYEIAWKKKEPQQ